MAAKHISLQKRLVKTSVLSSVAAGAVAFVLLVGISIYQSMSMQDEIMDEIADALLLVQPNQNEGPHIAQLSDEFDLQYQLIHQQKVVLQSDSFELASVVNFLDMQHEHFDYVWFQHALWRSYQSFDQDTQMQVVIYQPMQVRFEKNLSSFAIYAVLLMILWLLQWLFSHFAIARQFKVMQMLSKKIDKIGLQFSIHKSNDSDRNSLIPFKDKLSLKEIRDFGHIWWHEVGRQPFLNYCIDGTNNKIEDFENLTNLFSPTTFCFTFSTICSTNENMKESGYKNLNDINNFANMFIAEGYNTRVFNPDGQDDIGGGCGQLWYVQEWMKNSKGCGQ